MGKKMKTSDWKDEEIAIPEGLETRLEQLIDDLAQQEAQTKRRRLWIGSISAAASVILLLSAGIFFQTQQKRNMQLTANNIENPELAYIEAQKALEKVSVNFNKGINQLALVSEKMDKTNHILDKTFNNSIK
ncbi:hypothetical protein AGMMS50262_13140 [Bacteroidia bacterium]|nr:hypothetical protein AGMMS50262_13140 [Bacteroidia bacterium]